MITYTIPVAFTYELIEADYDGDMTLFNTLLGAGLQAEPDATGAGRGPLTRWMGYTFGKPRMLRDEAIALLPLTAGDPNPFFTFINSMNAEGVTIERGATYATMRTTNESWSSAGRMALLYSLGGDATNLEYWFVVADIDEDVPVGFTRSTITENDVERQATWAEWCDELHPPVQYDGLWYVASNSSGGVVVPVSEWVPFMLGGLLSPIPRSDFIAVQQANAVE